jgi:putative oxidoreductase
MDLGILILRVAVGLAIAAHGSQKLLGWFGGAGLRGAEGFMAQLGFRPAKLWALASALGEFAGGLLLALGLLSPLGPAAVIAVMTTAALAVHWEKGFFGQNGGFELPFVYAVAALAIAVSGPGALSLDHAWGVNLPQPMTALAAIAAVLIGVGVAFMSRGSAMQLPGRRVERRATPRGPLETSSRSGR